MDDNFIEIKLPSASVIPIVGIIFIVLKLTGCISWAWWQVLAPFWIPAAVIFCILTFCAIILLAAAIIKAWKSEKYKDTK